MPTLPCSPALSPSDTNEVKSLHTASVLPLHRHLFYPWTTCPCIQDGNDRFVSVVFFVWSSWTGVDDDRWIDKQQQPMSAKSPPRRSLAGDSQLRGHRTPRPIYVSVAHVVCLLALIHHALPHMTREPLDGLAPLMRHTILLQTALVVMDTHLMLLGQHRQQPPSSKRKSLLSTCFFVIATSFLYMSKVAANEAECHDLLHYLGTRYNPCPLSYHFIWSTIFRLLSTHPHARALHISPWLCAACSDPGIRRRQVAQSSNLPIGQPP